MSSFHLIHNNNALFSTYDNEQIVFAFCDIKNAIKVKNILINHYNKTNKWINKIDSYLEIDKNIHKIDLKENLKKSKKYKKLEISSFNMDNKSHCQEIERIYKMSNIRLFIVNDYTNYISNNSLSIQGITINNECDKDYNEFIKSLYTCYYNFELDK